MKVSESGMATPGLVAQRLVSHRLTNWLLLESAINVADTPPSKPAKAVTKDFGAITSDF